MHYTYLLFGRWPRRNRTIYIHQTSLQYNIQWNAGIVFAFSHSGRDPNRCTPVVSVVLYTSRLMRFFVRPPKGFCGTSCIYIAMDSWLAAFAKVTKINTPKNQLLIFLACFAQFQRRPMNFEQAPIQVLWITLMLGVAYTLWVIYDCDLHENCMCVFSCMSTYVVRMGNGNITQVDKTKYFRIFFAFTSIANFR